MIIEEEKIEIVDDKKVEEDSNFKKVQNEEKTKTKHPILVVIIFMAFFLCLISTIFIGFTIYNYNNNSYIAHGIYINGINISGLTKADAKQKLEQYYQEKLSNDITLIHGDYTAYIKPSEINLTYDINSAVNYAYEYGKTNNIFEDNYHVFTAMICGINISPKSDYNEASIINALNQISSELPDAIVESAYYIDGNKLIITKGKDGSVIDTNRTLISIQNNINNINDLAKPIELSVINSSPKQINIEEIHTSIYKQPKDAYYTTNPFVVYPSENGLDFSISLEEANNIILQSADECEIPLKTLYPNTTTNMIGAEAFPDQLGTFSTRYVSNANRTTNLRLAAEKINGCVLLPGEIFSYNQTVGERTIAAGYKEAAVYENGQVVQGLGGGICQISTTLYNAALFANLGIVELYNHQFVPSYVPAGRDATVVYGVKDFKFKNTRKYAIKITCSVSGGVATFTIWGVKEDVEYDVSVYAPITSRTSSYIKSSTYRTLKLNGEVVSTEHITNSTYKSH